MAEQQGPGSPPPPGGGGGDEGENKRIDRNTTPLRGPTKFNTGAGLVALALALGGLWFALSGEDAVLEPPPPTQEVNPQEAQAIPPPPLPVAPVNDPPPEPPQVPLVDPLVEERARLLLARIQRLQKEMDERRHSKMLVVSHASAAAPAASPGGLGDNGPASPGPTPSPPGGGDDNPNTPHMGDVGPVLEQVAVQARLLRTTGYTITEGTVIPGVLETAIHSALPGLVRALNAADVYSHDGSQLLIPKGSRLVGRYQSNTRRGQVRVFIVWTRLIRADGMSVLINSPGTDPLGRAGLEGEVDTHFFQIFGSAILLSILDAGLEIGIQAVKEQGNNNTNIGQGSSGLDRAGEIALRDSIQIQPTIHIDQGTRISIMVARDLDFEAVEMAWVGAHRK